MTANLVTTAELAILDRLDKATTELHAAAKAAITLARSQAASTAHAGDDDYMPLRMPTPGSRCPVSGYSRSTIEKLIREKAIRSKLGKGRTRFYSGADARALVNSEPPLPVGSVPVGG